MKKIIALILIVSTLFVCAACSTASIAEDKTEKKTVISAVVTHLDIGSSRSFGALYYASVRYQGNDGVLHGAVVRVNEEQYALLQPGDSVNIDIAGSYVTLADLVEVDE